MTTVIPLHGKIAAGRVALVDDADFELVNRYRWWASERARTTGSVPLTYALGRLHGASSKPGTYMHRLIAAEYQRVEHRDQNGLNNQRANLREATQSQNLANARRRSDNTSGYKGVSWQRDHSFWVAKIWVAGQQRHLGYFTDPRDAARAYNTAALAAWGEFSCLNDLDD